MTTDAHAEHPGHEVHPDHGSHDGKEHWTDLQYIQLALALAVITGLEVILSYTADFWGPMFLPLLLFLMVVKFFAVVFWFMHLRFDNRLFGLLFYMGLGLAVGVYTIALLTFKFFSP